MKYLIVILKIGLSVGLVWYAFRRFDFASAWSTLLSIPATALLPAIALLFLQFLLGAYRLRELLGQLSQRCRYATVLDTVMVGAFFSQTFISFVGGDAMRIWRMMRAQVPAAAATQSVLLDRLAGFAGVVVILLVTIPFLVPLLKSFEMEVGLLLIATAVLGILLSVFVLRRLPEKMKDWRLVGVVLRFVSLGVDIGRSGRGAVYVLGLSILIQVANVFILFILARGLAIDITLGMCFLFMPTVLFLSMLPISVAGWGVREGAMVAALGLVSVPPHQSLALSICFGLSLVFVSLPGGVLWFASRRAVSTPAPSSRPTKVAAP